MEKRAVNRVLLAGTGSGSGKTTITCGILNCLQKRGLMPAAFKCGPDYIDSMFHSRVLDIPTGNLDSFFSDRTVLNRLLLENSKGKDIVIIEGVMGYYDGIGFLEKGSSKEIAELTKTPVVLIVNCKGMSNSIGALLKGFVSYSSPSLIKGVIFNRLSPGLYEGAKQLAKENGLMPLGYLPPLKNELFQSRHLGLVTAEEIEGFREKIEELSNELEKTVDIPELLQLAQKAELIEGQAVQSFSGESDSGRQVKDSHKETELQAPVIAIARDHAFCFLYKDNVDYLKRAGCEIKYFSPLKDKSLPAGTSGLILSGGYPELYAKELSENYPLREEINRVVLQGMPCIAECGGFLYLHEGLVDESGVEYPMAGVVHGKCFPAGRLSRFGYITMEAKEGGLLCEKGAFLTAHEFHYWESQHPGSSFHAVKPGNGKSWEAALMTESLYAGFPHLYFYGNEKAAKRFIKQAGQYSRTQKEKERKA